MSTKSVKVLGMRLKWLTLALMILTPIIILIVLLVYGPFGLMLMPRGIEIHNEVLNWYNGSLVTLLSLLVPITYMIGFVHLYKLFDLYSRGIVFEKNNIILIRKAGIILIAIDIVYMVQKVISGPLFSLLGVTESHVSVELRISMLVIGALIVLISRVMEMGRELFKRDQLTI